MMPALLALLILMVGYGMTTDSFGAAVSFLFQPDFSKLTTGAVLTALGHAFFTLSLASATMIAYGSYLPARISIPRSACVIALIDTAVALLAGLAIFPIVFANGLEPGAGPGLVFQTLPLAFAQMPGGHFFGSVFFILLVFAAWTSSISLLESSVEWLEEKGLSRAAAAITGGVAAWALGLASLLSLNLWSQFQPLGLGKTIFDLLDYLTANIMMPLAGLLTAIFAGWILSRNISEQELQNAAGYRLWRFLIRYVAPVAVLAIALYNLI
jgi:NSS family neurotransmitter:Na+ symporter